MTKNYQVRIAKMYLSPHQIRDKEFFAEVLALTKDEVSYARKNNSLILWLDVEAIPFYVDSYTGGVYGRGLFGKGY